MAAFKNSLFGPLTASNKEGNLCKKLFFGLLGASGCLPVASGSQSGFAKSFGKVCIICTWAPLVASFGFLMLQSYSIFTIFCFVASTFSCSFQINPVLSFHFYEIMVHARVGSIILEMGIHQLRP